MLLAEKQEHNDERLDLCRCDRGVLRAVRGVCPLVRKIIGADYGNAFDCGDRAGAVRLSLRGHDLAREILRSS